MEEFRSLGESPEIPTENHRTTMGKSDGISIRNGGFVGRINEPKWIKQNSECQDQVAILGG
jgi:hypothetical protein